MSVHGLLQFYSYNKLFSELTGHLGHGTGLAHGHMDLAPVDCKWSDWQIGECSQSCGGGIRTNNRSKIVEEANGGKCPGDEYDNPTIMTENCNEDVYCPGKISALIFLKTNIPK